MIRRAGGYKLCIDALPIGFARTYDDLMYDKGEPATDAKGRIGSEKHPAINSAKNFQRRRQPRMRRFFLRSPSSTKKNSQETCLPWKRGEEGYSVL
jgi:hypothetical protein